MIITMIPIGGIPLHLQQNNLTYHSTGKNIAGKIFNIREYKKRSMKRKEK